MNRKNPILSMLLWIMLFVPLSAKLEASFPNPANPVNISTPSTNAVHSQVAVAPSGDAIAVWTDSTSQLIETSRYTFSTNSWSAVTAFPGSALFADFPQVAINPTGNGVAVWYEVVGGSTVIRGSYYDATVVTPTWSTPVSISLGAFNNAIDPQVGIDSAGNAIAVWQRFNGTNSIIQASKWDNTIITPAWSVPVNLSANSGDASFAQIAVNASGNAVAVWIRNNGTKDVAQAKHFNGTTWDASAIDLSDTSQSAQQPQVGIDTSGNAIAVWSRFNGANNIVQTKFYNGTSWDVTATDLTAAGLSATFPQIAMNGSGKAIAIWQRPAPVNTVIQAKHFDGSTWEASATDLSNNTQNAQQGQIAINALGNAIAVWNRFDGLGNIIAQAKTYDVSTLWSATTSNLSLAGANATDSQIGIDALANGIAVWTYPVAGFTRIQTTSSNPITDAATSIVTASPTSVLANGVATSTITVTLKDLNSAPVAGHTVTLAAGSGSSIISAASGLSNVSGVVTFTVKDSTAESVTYTATDTTNSVIITQTASVSFTSTTTSPSVSTVVASPTSVQADGSATSTITVTLLTSGSTPLSLHTVTLAASSGSSIISTASGPSTGSGVVTFTVKDSTVENVTYTATDTTDNVVILQQPTVSFIQRVTSAANSTVTASPVSVEADGVATSTITVTLKNANNVSVQGHTVTLAAGSGSSIISAASGPSNASGVVTFTVTDLVAEAVIYTATDSTNLIPIAQSAQVTFTTPVTSPSVSTLVASPTAVPSDGTTPSTITVTFLDSNGVPIQGHTASLAANTGSSVISPPSGVSDINGQVTFTVTDALAEIVTYTATDVTDSVTISQTASVTFGDVNPAPPTFFSGKLKKDKFVTQTELINVLTWGQSPDSTTTGYRIYQNGLIVYETGNNAPFQAVLHNRKKTEIYSIVSVNAAGLESTPLLVTVTQTRDSD